MQIEDAAHRRDFLEYLDRLLNSPVFASSRRRAELLRYLVGQTFAGDSRRLTEYAIALDVYRKPESFDPRMDSTVRSDISRLRRLLADYYARDGAADPWRIAFPNRGYIPVITQRQPLADVKVRNGLPLVVVNPDLVKSAPRRSRLLWPAAAITGLMLFALAIILFRPGPGTIRSVAVLPFDNLTGDPNETYLSEGITDQITDALAERPELRVVARTSAFQFRKGVDVRQVGRKLGVEAVVEGSLHKNESGYRLIVHVSRTGDGFHILARSFDVTSSDLPTLEKDVSAPILAAFHIGRTGGRTHRPDPAAYALFLKARALSAGGEARVRDQIIGYLNEAIQHDPQWADAYAALGGAFLSFAVNNDPKPLQFVPQIKEAVARALELDPNCAAALATSGYLDAMILYHWARGEQELREAVQRAPGIALHHNWLGLVLIMQARFDEGLRELRAAENLDPLNARTGASLGYGYFLARRYDDALNQYTKVHGIHPEMDSLHFFIGNAYEGKEDYLHARAEYELAMRAIPWEAKIGLAHQFAVTGHPAEARKILAEFQQPVAGRSRANPLDMAIVEAALGDVDRSFNWLDQAYESRRLFPLKVFPSFDPLRKDPRYQALLLKAGFLDK